MKFTTRAIAMLTGLILLFSGLIACSPGSTTSSSSGTTLTVGTVNNSQMVQMEKLTTQVFEKENPTIKVNFVTLPENDLRTKVTQDVATNAGKFDIATIGSYDTPIWAHNGWLQDLAPYFDKMSAQDKSSYNYNDLLKPIMASLSYKNDPYSLPFYGESSMLMYNKQLFAQHHLSMPEHPTWDQIAQFAKTINDPANGIAGIVLRGQSGWGMNMAPLDTMINTYGSSWFDMNWKPQLSTPAVEQAVTDYVTLVQKYGEPDASTAGWQECLNLMTQGKAGMFYDATSFGGSLETPATSKIAGNVGYVYAPTKVTTNGSRWLWAWSLGLVNSSHNKDAAFKFITWATSAQYLTLAGKTFGWANVPPGTRASIYQNPDYQKASPFAKIALDSINSATPTTPTLNPVPYHGVQYVGIPQFESVGQQISEYISAVIAGKMTVKQALQKGDQFLASQVNKDNTAGY
ncbi:sugar ABC transporter substrate-binding protein [Ktedonosporobacter rubrisoli]|uniref:Sugar ABC transporter substrate-binding protein n=1 Tax=Ktedonosporobacter rubrisoli TaxID=2509675 RepID=A0A4P6K4R5_KTERU|nr:sugar ABC transporter substrate-binding protein [Ktedonosporobacter rubrisoli]QBD82952.1 sugar ABC transporter substrate-binding protein [Ktedonosporobacter rubrisoli]